MTCGWVGTRTILGEKMTQDELRPCKYRVTHDASDWVNGRFYGFTVNGTAIIESADGSVSEVPATKIVFTDREP